MAVMVPNRRLYIEPATGKVIFAFDCTWLWSFPEAILTLRCRQVWDGFIDGQLVPTEFGQPMADQLLQLRADVYGFNNLDISSLTARQFDIWVIEAPDLDAINDRLLALTQLLCQLKDQHNLHQLVFTTWEILKSAGPLGEFYMEDFWKSLSFLWTHRYKYNQPEQDSLLIHDFGLADSTEVIIKLNTTTP